MTRQKFDNLTVNEQLNEIERQTGLYIYDEDSLELEFKSWIKELIEKDYNLIEAIRQIKDEDYINGYYEFYVIQEDGLANGLTVINGFDYQTDIIDYYYDELVFDDDEE